MVVLEEKLRAAFGDDNVIIEGNLISIFDKFDCTLYMRHEIELNEIDNDLYFRISINCKEVHMTVITPNMIDLPGIVDKTIDKLKWS